MVFLFAFWMFGTLFASSAAANTFGVGPRTLLNNGSFESGLTGWIVSEIAGPFRPVQARANGFSPGYGFFTSVATAGSFSATHGFDGNGLGVIGLAQDVLILGNRPNLVFDYRVAWDMQSYSGSTLPRVFRVVIKASGGGGPPLKSTTILTAMAGTKNLDSGPLTGVIDLTSFVGSTMRISFETEVPQSSTGPGFFQLDNVGFSATGAPNLPVVTGPASNATVASATLNGTVNPLGVTTTAQFEYGLTTAYGNPVSVTLSPPNGSTVQGVRAAISGLQAGKTYHYRLTATNSQGTTFGNDATFTTGTPRTLINNGSFENGLTNWIVANISEPFLQTQVRPDGFSPGFGLFNCAATDGQLSATHGFDGNGPGVIGLAQDVFIPAERPSLAFDYRVGWDMQSFSGSTLPRVFRVVVKASGGGGPPLLSTGILTLAAGTKNLDSGPLTGVVDLTSFAGSTVRISFEAEVPEYHTGPGFFELDNVGLASDTLPQPAVTTGGANEISSTSATLKGTINPKGLPTTSQFEYGLTTGYGITASVALSPSNGSTTQNVTAHLSGLQPNQTYHYRLSGTNSQGTRFGADATFTTNENTKPVLTLNGANPFTIEASASYTDPGATANDAEEGPLTPIISANSVMPNQPGLYSLTWTATDSFSATGEATRTVNVVDTTPPSITVPSNITVNATTATGAVVNFATSASDIVDGSVSVTNNPASGSFFLIGSTTVTATAIDAAGNPASKTFTVSVAVPPVGAAEMVSPLITLTESDVNLTLKNSVPGRTYQLQISDDLATGNWQDSGSVQTGNGNDLLFTAPYTPNMNRRFYRLKLN